MTIALLPGLTAGGGLLIGSAITLLVGRRRRRRARAAPAAMVPVFERAPEFGPVERVSWYDNERLRFLVVRDQITSDNALLLPENERAERVTHWLERWTTPI